MSRMREAGLEEYQILNVNEKKADYIRAAWYTIRDLFVESTIATSTILDDE